MDNNSWNQTNNLNAVNQSSDKNLGLGESPCGPRWLVEERDACGVGFIASLENQASHELIVKALSALGLFGKYRGLDPDSLRRWSRPMTAIGMCSVSGLQIGDK